MLFASNFRPSHHLNAILRGDILCMQPLWIIEKQPLANGLSGTAQLGNQRAVEHQL